MLADALVQFYRLWHGRWRWRGAGALLRVTARWARGLQHYPLRLPEGHAVHVDFRDISAFYWLNETLGETFEEAALERAICRATVPGAVLWDVGANAGLLAYRLARAAHPRRLHFFEPNPTIFALATEAVRPFPAAQGHQVALSNRAGQAELVIVEAASVVATMEAASTGRTGRALQIECQVADEMLEAGLLEPPDLIKIDTEGHELSVLQGMARLLARHRPIVFFEHLSLSDAEVIGATPDGYDLYSLSDADGTLVKGFHRDRGHNSAFLPT